MADGAVGVGNLSPLPPPFFGPARAPVEAARAEQEAPPPPRGPSAKAADQPPKRSWWARTKRLLGNVKHRIVNATNKKYAYRRALVRNIRGETANNRRKRLRKARDVTRGYFTKRGVKVPEYLNEQHANNQAIKNVVSGDFQRNGYWTRKFRGLKKWWGRRTGKVAPGDAPERENTANTVVRRNRERAAAEAANAAEEAAAAAAARAAAAQAARDAARIQAIEDDIEAIDARNRTRAAEGKEMSDEEAEERSSHFGLRRLVRGLSKNYEGLRQKRNSNRQTNAGKKEELQTELGLLVARQGALGAAAGEQGVRMTPAQQAVVNYILQADPRGDNLISKIATFRAPLEELNAQLADNGVREDNVLFIIGAQPITIKYIRQKYIEIERLCISIAAPETTRGFRKDIRDLNKLLTEEMRRINNFNPLSHAFELLQYMAYLPIIKDFLGENREILVNLRRILNHLLGLLEAV